jgi:hypothetical protein
MSYNELNPGKGKKAEEKPVGNAAEKLGHHEFEDIQSFLHGRSPEPQAKSALKFLAWLEGQLHQTPSDPAASYTEDERGIMLFWRNEKHHFQIEFGKDTYWFYHNLKADVAESSDDKGADLERLIRKIGTEVFFR